MNERELIETAMQSPEQLEGMRVLIAVISCARDKECHAVIRETWANDIAVDYRIFMGNGCEITHPDEVLLEVADDWNGLPAKTKAMCVWAFEQGYDYVFKCDTDSYVCVPRLLRSGFEKWHYSGCCGAAANIYPDACFPANGGGYWLSRRAMEYFGYHGNLGLGKNCEDWCVFLSLMKGAGIFVHHDDRYRANRIMPGLGPGWMNNYIILHDAGDRNLRNPQYMREAHKAAGGL